MINPIDHVFFWPVHGPHGFQRLGTQAALTADSRSMYSWAMYSWAQWAENIDLPGTGACLKMLDIPDL